MKRIHFFEALFPIPEKNRFLLDFSLECNMGEEGVWYSALHLWKFWPTKKGLKQRFWTKKALVFCTPKKKQKTDRKGGGVYPYDQPDLKISIFLQIPQE